MLETLLKPNTGAALSGCVRWAQPMDGVRVCDFDCALTVPPALPAEPSIRQDSSVAKSAAFSSEISTVLGLF